MQGIQRNLSLWKVWTKQETSGEFAWPLSPQMTLHEKPSCCGVKLPHGLRSTSENHSHLTVCCCINKCNLNLCYSKRKLSILCSDNTRFSGPELISDNQKNKQTVEMCAVLKWVHISNCFLGKMDVEFSVPKTKGTIPIFISDRCKSTRLSWYGGAAEQTAWVTGICVKVPLTWRHILVLYRDILYSAIKMTSFMGSSWLLDQDNASSHSACAYNNMVS